MMKLRMITNSFCILMIMTLLMGVEGRRKRECKKDEGKKGKRCHVKREGRTGKVKKAAAPFWRKGWPKEKQLIAREGGDISMNCAIKGRPYPSFSWLRNGKSLSTKGSKKYHQRRSKLKITSVQIDDTGTYTCIAKNKLGHLNFTYSIKVLENMPLEDIDIVDKPENQTAHVGDTVIFHCRSEDYPKPQVHWAKRTDDRGIIKFIPPTSNKSDVLVLHNVNKSDTGTYMCYISNDVVKKQLSARLTVIEKGESLPFEPPCSLHIRREHFTDIQSGCTTKEPLEMHYCMGSCGRSYFIPKVMPEGNDTLIAPGDYLNQTCGCCVGKVNALRIVHLHCPLGRTKKALYTLLKECFCDSCGTSGNKVSGNQTTPVTEDAS